MELSPKRFPMGNLWDSGPLAPSAQDKQSSLRAGVPMFPGTPGLTFFSLNHEKLNGHGSSQQLFEQQGYSL
jgi:hypothetical protein